MNPTFRYHAEKAPEGRIIRSIEELAALGPGWVDTPAKFGVSVEAPALEPEAAADPVQIAVPAAAKRGRRPKVQEDRA